MNFASLKQGYKNIADLDKTKPTGKWGEFLKLTEEDKKSSGYLIFNNIDNITDIDGFRFDVLSKEEVDISAKYTKHNLESGRPISDACAFEPLSITLTGTIGDIFTEQSKARKILNNVSAGVGIINSYLPAKTQRQTQKISNIQNQIESVYSRVLGVVNTAQVLKDGFDAINPRKILETRTQQITKFLNFCFRNSILLNIYSETFGNLENIVITNVKTVKALQTNNTIEFTITLEQKEFATTQIITIDKKKFLGRVKGQVEDIKKQQKTQGQNVGSPSLLYSGGSKLLNIL